ncbi:hypothetical protein DV737_g1832, partial [Chaetothyriales sp. CBS 132003]
MTGCSLPVRHLSASRVAANRTYADAVAALNTLQSNFAVVDAIRKSGKKMNEQSIPEMTDVCVLLQPSDLNSLHAIHIAGTKGKGSTAAYVASILAQFADDYGLGPSKIGLFTSPHLRFVRERIQINGSPLSEDQFAMYFFDTWDRLEAAAEGTDVDPSSVQAKPAYFRFLTLMAFHTYKRENCDPAIIECGIGGAYDGTNIIERPSVTAITSLGIDHVSVLGNTLTEIAWHKAGIMKAGAKCYTPSSQPDEAKAVLNKVAAERGVELVYVPLAPELTADDSDGHGDHTPLALQADFQRINASLAVAIAQDFLLQRGVHPDRGLILRGLRSARWPGRCDVRAEPENSITWCLDGGHTLDSIQLAGQWFATRRAKLCSDAKKSNQSHSRPFDTVIFCTNTTYRDSGFKPDQVSMNTNKSDVDKMKVQMELANVWSELDPAADVRVVKTIEEAVQLVRVLCAKVNLLLPDLHLVGGALEVLEAEKERGEKSQCPVDEVAWR